jgi:hypothetical protein
MSQQELLKYLAATLEAAGIPYMITGSTVSSLQGHPRSTHDIDVVVGLRPSAVSSLLAGFAPPKFYLDEDAIRDGIKTCTMFNAIDTEGGDKVDFWPLKPEAFHQTAFRRRIQQRAFGMLVYVSQPDDTILAKLWWAKEYGGSEKQIADCAGVYEVNYKNLHMEYLQEWAKELGVSDFLSQVQKKAIVKD